MPKESTEGAGKALLKTALDKRMQINHETLTESNLIMEKRCRSSGMRFNGTGFVVS
jgi:hypothetical protein